MSSIDDAFLNHCRSEGDAEGDALVRSIFAAIGADASSAAPPDRRLFRALLERDAVPSQWTPPAVRSFLAAPLPAPIPPAAVLRRGQRVFAAYGPEIMMALGCYSLPAAYAANDGVRVLAQTGYLESFPNRRLVETAQMIVDVMRPGGLDPDGAGVRNARRVRLMHGAIRHLIGARTDPAWDAARFGVPINQEDLAGTLTTFAWLPLDALARLGVRLAREDRDAYVQTWGVVARILGLREELIPADANAAETLSAQIQARQVRPDVANPDGRELTRALLELMNAHIPARALRWGPASLMRLFLPAPVADALAIPRHRFGDALVRCGATLAGVANGLFAATSLERRFFRTFNVQVIDVILSVERGGKRTDFDLPLTLRGSWQLE